MGHGLRVAGRNPPGDGGRVRPRATADDCMALMTDKRIRHLPVLDGEQLAGIISIRDVVRAVVDEQQRTISDLVSYIVSGA